MDLFGASQHDAFLGLKTVLRFQHSSFLPKTTCLKILKHLMGQRAEKRVNPKVTILRLRIILEFRSCLLLKVFRFKVYQNYWAPRLQRSGNVLWLFSLIKIRASNYAFELWMQAKQRFIENLHKVGLYTEVWRFKIPQSIEMLTTFHDVKSAQCSAKGEKYVEKKF